MHILAIWFIGGIKMTNKGLCIHYINQDLGKTFLETGANWIRSDIGTLAWASLDQNTSIYNFAKQNNIKLLGILDYNIVNDNFTLDDWKDAVKNAVQKFNCEGYEIWNEPFSKYAMKGYQNGTSFHYFDMVKSAYQIIKKIRPKSIVIGGGGLFSSQIDIAMELKKLGIEKYVDAISLHIYLNIPKFLAEWLLCSQKYYYGWYIYSVITKYKDVFQVPLWITEIGMQYTQCSLMEAIPKDIMAFWYEFQDNDGQYGIVDKNGNKKDSFECFKRW